MYHLSHCPQEACSHSTQSQLRTTHVSSTLIHRQLTLVNNCLEGPELEAASGFIAPKALKFTPGAVSGTAKAKNSSGPFLLVLS